MSPSPKGMAAATALGRPLRVMHFVSGGFSGATQVAIDLCAPHPGMQSLLVLRRRPSVDPKARMAQLRRQGLAVELVPRWSHTATIRAIRRICQQWQPDVLVAHGFSEHLWGRMAGLQAAVPRLIQVEHNVRERYTPQRLRLSLQLAQHTETIVAVSEAVRDALLRLGHPPERCKVVLNGIDLDRWSSPLPWDERENALVMPARFAAQKDHATLIRALALLSQQGLRPTLYLAGAGKRSARWRMQTLAHRLSVSSQVQFLGQVADMPALLGRVKLCVLSSHYEGLGLGLIEGMAAGACAIGTNVEGVREILTDPAVGFLVPHEDAQALAQTLARVLTDDALAERTAAAGRHHVHARFDRHRMCQEYLALFQD